MPPSRFTGRGADLNAALGNLDPFAERADELLRILDSQRLAVKQLVPDGGADVRRAQRAPGPAPGADPEHRVRVLDDGAPRHRAPARSSRCCRRSSTSRADPRALDEFAVDTDPLVHQLRPVARQLSGTRRAEAALAEAKRFSTGSARSSSAPSRLQLAADRPQRPAAAVPRPARPILRPADPDRRHCRPLQEGGDDIPRTHRRPECGQRACRPTDTIQVPARTGPLGPAVLGRRQAATRLADQRLRQAGRVHEARPGTRQPPHRSTAPSGLTATFLQGDFTNDLWDRTQSTRWAAHGLTNTDDVAAPPCAAGQGQLDRRASRREDHTTRTSRRSPEARGPGSAPRRN